MTVPALWAASQASWVYQRLGMEAHHDSARALGRIPGVLGVQGGIVADHLVVIDLGFPLSLPVVGVRLGQGIDLVRGLAVEMPGDLDAQPVQDLGAVFAGIHRLFQELIFFFSF